MTTTSPITPENRTQSAPLHGNSFAGISGCVSMHAPCETDTRVLTDPAGHWAMRLSVLEPATARMLLQILRDLAPPATQEDGMLIRQVAAFDVAAMSAPQLVGEMERGLATLDVLARKLTRTNYMEIGERTLRRTLLSQISNDPLMERLGVRPPAYSSAAI